jgi:hypothetical protein
MYHKTSVGLLWSHHPFEAQFEGMWVLHIRIMFSINYVN